MAETVGSWWIPRRELEPREGLIYSRNANRSQGSRGVGGKLFLTQRRVLFTPHRLDGLLWGKPWEGALGEISSAGVESRGSAKKGLLGGGIRTRLRIRTFAGDEELFVINQLDEVLAHLEEAGIAREPAQPAAPSSPLSG